MSPYPLYGEIYYKTVPWSKAEVSETSIRCVALSSTVRFPLEEEPRFWNRLLQLSFAFDRGDTASIAVFYRQHGAVYTSIRNNGLAENRKRVQTWLEWFHTMTCLVRWVKERREAPLWECFGEHRKAERFRDGAVVLFGKPDVWPNIQYRLREKVDRRSGTVRLATPASSEELFTAAWEAMRDSATRHMSRILVMTPYIEPGPVPAIPTLIFNAVGALDAAFLQWFFQEVASVEVTACTADRCRNPVIPPRRVYCSERCKQREKKRRHRERKREEGTLRK